MTRHSGSAEAKVTTPCNNTHNNNTHATGKKKSGRFCEYIHSSSLVVFFFFFFVFFSLPIGNYHPASAALTGERGGGGRGWAGRGFSASVPNLLLYALADE
jgi:hypothetical protein